jgi:hypothetical protein
MMAKSGLQMDADRVQTKVNNNENEGSTDPLITWCSYDR